MLAHSVMLVVSPNRAGCWAVCYYVRAQRPHGTGEVELKVGTRLTGRTPQEIADSARRAERIGFDTYSSSETNHNPFSATDHRRRAH